MKRYLCIIFVVLCIGTLSAQNQGKVKVDSRLRVFELDSTDWLYPWYVLKHENKWENTSGDGITAKDTVHLICNSTCYQDLSGAYKHRLPFCRARLVGDTLVIQVYDESASNDEWVTFRVCGKNFICDYEQNYNAEAGLAINSSLTLSKRKVRKGDYLVGKMEVYYQVIKNLIDPSYLEKGRIRGNFKVKVE